MSESDPPVVSVDGALARARRHVEEGRLGEARAVYEQIRHARPQRYEGHLGAAQIAAMEGQVSDCLAILPDAIRAHPECLPAYQMMARLGIDGGVSDTAIQWLEFGANHLAGEPVIFEWLVTLYAIEGRMDDLAGCLTHYGRLRGMSPGDAAMMFARQPHLTEDLRSRITQAAGF